MNAANRLGNENRDVNCYNFVAAAFLNFMRYCKMKNMLDNCHTFEKVLKITCVSDDDFVDGRLFNEPRGVLTEQSMCS